MSCRQTAVLREFYEHKLGLLLFNELYDLGNIGHERGAVEGAEPVCFFGIDCIVLPACVNEADMLAVFCGLKAQRKAVCLLCGDNKNIIKHFDYLLTLRCAARRQQH